jgi:hypothetical protein
MVGSLTADELAELDRLFQRLTPEERGLLVLVRDQVADLPAEKQREFARELAKFLDQRIKN